MAWQSASFAVSFIQWPVHISPDAGIVWTEALLIWDGIWPYAQTGSINLPGTQLINFAAQAVFGKYGQSIRYADIALTLSAAVLLFFLLKRYISLIAAIVPVSLMLFLPAVATPYGAWQRDTMMAVLWLAIWLVFEKYKHETGNRRQIYFLAVLAALTALGTLIKPFTVLFAFLLWAGYLLSHRNQLPVKETAMLSLFGVLTAGFIIMPFVIKGGFPERWFGYIQVYANHMDPPGAIPVMIDLIHISATTWFMDINHPVRLPNDIGHLTILSVFLVFAGILTAPSLKARLYLIYFLISGLLSFALQGRGFAYHLIPVWFAQLISTGFFLDYLIKRLQQGSVSKKIKLIWLATGIVLAGSLLIRNKLSIQLYKAMGLSPVKKESLFIKSRLSDSVVNLMESITPATGAKPAIGVFESSTKAVSFAASHGYPVWPPVLVDYPLFDRSKIRESERERYRKWISQKEPAVIIIDNGITGNGKSESRVKDFTYLSDYLSERFRIYKEVTELNQVNYTIYLRNDISLQ